MASPNYFGTSYNLPALPNLPKPVASPYGTAGNIIGNLSNTPAIFGYVPSLGQAPRKSYYSDLNQLPSELQDYLGQYLTGYGESGGKQARLLDYANELQNQYGTDTNKFVPYALRGSTNASNRNAIDLSSPVKAASYFYNPQDMGIYSQDQSIDPITGQPANAQQTLGYQQSNPSLVGSIPGLPSDFGQQYRGSYGAGSSYFDQGPGAINQHISPDRLASDQAYNQANIDKLTQYINSLKGTYGDIQGLPDAKSLYDMLIGQSVYGRGYNSGTSSQLMPMGNYSDSRISATHGRSGFGGLF